MKMLTALTIPFIQAFLLRWTGNKAWMRDWAKNPDKSRGREYDFKISKDFIKNSPSSSVFSPICSELNVLLQACAGEYGDKFKDKSTSYISELMNVFEKMDKSKFKVSHRVYIPEGCKGMCPKELSGCSLRVYTQDDATTTLLKEHEEWARKESNKLLESTLGVDKFLGEYRIYASLVYFKDQWHKKFLKECTKRDFHLRGGKKVPRIFINRKDYFKHRRYERDNDEFDMVTVPYVGRVNHHGNFERYMVYLIPKNVGANLSTVWKNFYKSMKDNNIGELLRSYSCKNIDLRVPRIGKLRSNLDLKDILRNTYGNGPAKMVVSRMTAYIDVDEEDAEAAALAETSCTDGVGAHKVLQIKANKPYIAFVYDTTVNRVLFVVKDMGHIETSICGN